MGYHKSIKSLFSQVERDMRKTMDSDVLDKVKDAEQEAINSKVYDVYEPYYYERREENGGLSDRDNMIPSYQTITGGVEMLVQNVTKGSNQDIYLSPLVSYGDGYNGLEYQYKYNRQGTAWKYLQSRDFITNTITRLQESLAYANAMREGMRKYGYKFYK